MERNTTQQQSLFPGFKSIIFSLLLIALGFLYPSNGVDDCIDKLPIDLCNAFVALFSFAITLYLFFDLLNKIKKHIQSS